MRKYIIILSSLMIIWLLVLPLIFEKLANTICTNISNKYGYGIKIEKPQLKLYPIPIAKFSAQNVKFESTNNSTDCDINNLKLTLRILPLLSGKIHINSFEADSLYSDIKLAKKIKINSEFFNKIKQSKITCDSAEIKNYRFKIYPADKSVPIEYTGQDFLYKLKSSYLKLKLNSKFLISNKTSVANINLFLPKNNNLKKTVFEIDLNNFDLSRLYLHFKEYLPKDITSLDGIINIRANKGHLETEIFNCKIINSDSVKNIIFPYNLKAVSKFTINKKDILFEKINFLSKHINISLDGRISNYLAASKTFIDLNIQINKSKVEELVKILPAHNLEELNIYNLKKYKFYGDTIGNLNIKGHLPEPDIFGEVFINNGILIKPIPNTKNGAIIKFKFIGRNVNFDVIVPTSNKEKVLVKGTQELYNIKYADFEVKSSEAVDLETAQNVLNPLHEILNFMVGPLPIMHISGKGNIDIVAKGNRKDPHIWGILNIVDCNAYFLDMPKIILKNANSRLVFNNKDAVFTLHNGLLNEKEIKIDGLCNLSGKFDFNIASKAQPVFELYNGIQDSKLIPELKYLPNFDNIQGFTDIDLKIYGMINSLKEIEYNKNLFTQGHLKINNISCLYQKLNISNLNGDIKIKGSNSDIKLVGKMKDEDLEINAKINNGIADILLQIPQFNPQILLEDEQYKNTQILPIVSLYTKYKGEIDKLDVKKIKLQANILPQKHNNYINYTQGNIILENNKLHLKNIHGHIKNPLNNFALDLKINKPLETNPTASGDIILKSPNTTFLNDIIHQKILPKEIIEIIKNFRFDEGKIDLNCKVNNNKLNFNQDLSGYKITYVPTNLPIEILNGNILMRNNLLTLDKINILADKMPILLNSDISDLQNPKFNIYLNSKPNQDFIDKYINKNQVYPIKIKGDIVYSAWLKGTKDNFELKALLNMNKDASVYHFGATVGDIENSIVLDLNSRIINNNELKIKDFSYDKLIDSQNGKQTRLNMLKAWGDVDVYKDDLIFKDLHIKTNTPTDARIFNIIFRKPNIKQGQFTSDLKINGKLSNPKVIGEFNIVETDIPFFDTVMKNINLIFKEKTIDIATKGDILGNDIVIEGILKNKLAPPYHIEKAKLQTKALDLNRIVNKLKISEVDNISTFESFEELDLSDLSFNNLSLVADSIHLRNINATDFKATTNLTSNGIFDIKDFVFNIAQGTLKGDFEYDLKTSDMSLNLLANEINANDITWALFDLNNQIYGDLTGKIDLTCNGTNFQNCMQTLSGNTKFKVKDGRMPKLGSLEYLLKAGNLVKSGFTGLSIGNIIDVITPLKTGDFSEISGHARIKDGVARNIEITTSGKNLSLFIWGTYNFSSSIADMEIFGYLSKKITNMFGVIGNISINTLFNLIPGVDLSKDSEVIEKINKIPGVELSSKNFRKFLAEIQGNINGEDYVTSFQWIN